MEGMRKIKKALHAAAAALPLITTPVSALKAESVDRPIVTAKGVEDKKMPRFMSVLAPMAPPRAFLDFCTRIAKECEAQNVSEATKAHRVEDTMENMMLLEVINRDVNKSLEQKLDINQPHRMRDRWDIPGVTGPSGIGDCEDYVLLKRKRLIETGKWNPYQLLITVVYDEKGEGHAVLTVRMKQGDYILDNKHDQVLLWSDVVTSLKYTFLMRQSFVDPKVWLSIKSLL
jgi:predicted transglutaminase-like cysteine proteinase